MTLHFSGYRQSFLRGEAPFFPQIYPAEPGEKIPEGFNTVSLKLDATPSSSLNWRESLAAAQSYIREGYLILWDLNLGLFDRLPLPLDDEGQFQTIAFALKHFSSEVWTHFEAQSLGALLFQGSFKNLFFPHQEEPYRRWKEENPDGSRILFCRDVALDYLKLLCVELADTVTPFLLLDTNEIDTAEEYFQLTRLDAFSHFRMIVKGKWPALFPFAIPALSFDGGNSPLGFLSHHKQKKLPEEKISLAICLPSQFHPEFENVLDLLVQKKHLFRVIPEQMLTYEWDGIDDLIVFSSNLTLQGKRKLQGFCAAGGRVITVGAGIGVVHEISLETAIF